MKSSSAIERKTFSVGHHTYMLGKLNWTPLPFQSKKNPHIPTRRYLHTALAHAGRLYVFGGMDDDSPIRQNRLFVMDLATLKWTTIEGRNFCQGRNGHSCALFRNQIFFFGGSQLEPNPTNDFFKFNPITGIWTLIESQTAPAERELALFTAVGDEFILLYGGIDLLQDHIFRDAFLWRDETWQHLTVNQNISERIGMGVAVCGLRIFLFGGEGPSQSGSLLFNTLYQLRVNTAELEAKFVQIPVLAGKIPQKRTAHGMSAISYQFFLIYGGEGADGKGGNTPLGDIWIFDVRERIWTEIQSIYGSITNRYEFSMVVHRNEIFVFGGFSDRHLVIDNLTRLQFLQAEPRIEQLCLSCQKLDQIKNQKEQTSARQLSISTGFLYNLALEIAFPFKAVELVFDAAEMMGAEVIRFFSRKTMQDFDYFVFQFSAALPLSTSSFLDMTKTDGDPRQVNITHILKLGAFRLGKTFMFVSVSDHLRSVFLCSVDSKFAPNFQDRAAHYSYIEDLQSGIIFPEGGAETKQTIYNIVRTQLVDPELVLSRKSGQALLVFQVNILPTVEKAYYYQLIFYNTPESDVKIYSNQHRNQLLEKLGYRLGGSPQFSLSSYLSISRLDRRIQVLLNNDQQPVSTINYLTLIRSYQQLGLVEEVQDKLTHPLVTESALFRCTGQTFLDYNQGVLIYCGGRLVDRYACSFGELLANKFYKRKYRQRNNLFHYLGVVQLSEELQLNFTGTKFGKTHRYRQILQQLSHKLKSHKTQGESGLEQLHDLKFSLGQSSKKVKKDAHNDTR